MTPREARLVWQIESETGVLTDVLMCRPEHYAWLDTNAVAHRTLGTATAFDPGAAQAQFAGLVDLLQQEGVQPHFLQPEPHLHYQVYTRDSSQTTPWGPVLTQLRMPERRGEYASVLAFHTMPGGLWRCCSEGTCEGGDIHIIRPGLLVIGTSGVRTDLAGARQFAGWFEAAGWEVRLQMFAEHFLHLDVLFCMASDRLAVCCIEILGDDFAAWLAQHGIEVVAASYREVMAMSCNILALGGNRVISPRHSRRLNAEFSARGLMVYDPPLDVFARGGGSIHCMTMPLRRERISS